MTMSNSHILDIVGMEAMKDCESVPSLNEARRHIYSIDFSNIIEKMVKHQGWWQSEAEKVCSMYQNFLYLNKKYGDKCQLPPSEEIDEFWHNHILDTKKYRKDCQTIFGRYLDHYPYFGIDESSNISSLNSAFEVMKTLYKEEFEENLNNVRLRASIRFVLKICPYLTRMFFQHSGKISKQR